MAELVKPSHVYKKSFVEALHEEGAQQLFPRYWVANINKDYDEFLKKVEDYARGENLFEDCPQEHTFFLVENSDYIGRVSIRESLTEKFKYYGGHIGYDIRPSKRGLGYGNEILKLALGKAKELGLSKVMVTCKSENVASRKIIINCGGELVDEVFDETRGFQIQRFFLAL
ncbi:GNAT family N-acetyltransferase [Patescibacteria group bacterium]|nr:GNAT family N-acetyltransferase [Patescibacteria group bacterium]